MEQNRIDMEQNKTGAKQNKQIDFSVLNDDELTDLENRVSNGNFDMQSMSDNQLSVFEQMVQQGLVDTGETQPDTDTTPAPTLPISERLSTGFRFDPQQHLEQRRAELGVAPGTSLEPTGINWANVLDIPGDIADIAGPALPVAGTIAATTLASPEILASGGLTGPAIAGAGAMVGEALRQTIGTKAYGFHDADMRDRLKKIGAEGSQAALAQYLAPMALRAITKSITGTLNVGRKILSSKGAAAFSSWFTKIFHNMRKDDALYAIKSLNRGIKDAVDPRFAGKGGTQYVQRKIDNVLFGDKGLVTRIRELGNKPGIREFYKRYLGLADDVLDAIYKYGQKGLDSVDDKTLGQLSTQIKEGVDTVINETGRTLAEAEGDLLTVAQGPEIKKYLSEVLTGANRKFMGKLLNAGIIKPAKNGKGYVMDKSFVKSGLGKGRRMFALFKSMLDDFAKKVKIVRPELAEFDNLVKSPTINAELLQAKLAELDPTGKLWQTVQQQGIQAARQAFEEMVGPAQKAYVAAKKISFDKLIKQYKQYGSQLDDDVFSGKLGSIIADYKNDLGGIIDDVAEQVGNTEVPMLRQVYGHLKDTFRNIRGKNVDIDAVEETLKKMYKTFKKGAYTRRMAEVDRVLKNKLGVKFMETMEKLNAREALGKVGENQGQIIDNFLRLIDDPYSRTNSAELAHIAKTLDRNLPLKQRISHIIKSASASQSLYHEGAQLFRARLIGNTLSGAARMALPVASGAAGYYTGGPQLALAGLALGFKAQTPRSARAILEWAARRGGYKPIKQIGKAAFRTKKARAGVEILRKLVTG